MYRVIITVVTILILLIGCQSSNFIVSEVEKATVSKTSDEVRKDDFVFRLVTEKEQYEEGEEVKLYGEIEYVGNRNGVVISHSSSAILYTIEEKIRGFVIEGAVTNVGLTTNLKQGVSYREEYMKSGGYSPTQDTKDFVRFMRDFLAREDFPTGHYVVKGMADFSVVIDMKEQQQKNYKIEAEVDFIVN
ncbi:hypothetical protein [Bacillus pinisoli]|uniref:hypothetical protein n=1 Tax=Bacillus pinisoli TaxID=2901866 RepID=UPI001FF2ABA0|nr:hypothetical protein [Bacillus pinisoli]